MTKDCGNHDCKRRKILRTLFAGTLIFLFLVLLAILLIWAILRPTKPTFVLQDATVFAFNVSSPPNLLSTNIQITIASRNPNGKIGIYYDRLEVYATYHDQQITLRTAIPPSYQGHKEVTIWSPFVYANLAPVAPYNGLALAQDQAAGVVVLMIRIDGRVRWKVGTLITGRYHLYVRCPAYITFGSHSNGIMVGNAVKYQLVESCSVSV